MTLHYHGLPLTPADQFEHMAGRNFCVSFATCRGRPTMVQRALEIGQSIMWDNGAFTFFTQGRGTWLQMDRKPLYEWLETYLAHPHWAVIPDVIDGSVEDQIQLLVEWPFSRNLGAPVWHLAAPLDWLLLLADSYPRICLGSSGAYWNVGGDDWARRMDEVFDYLHAKRRHPPQIHGLRMLAQVGKRWPLASADSVNVARNFRRNELKPCCMAQQIDNIQSPGRWLGGDPFL